MIIIIRLFLYVLVPLILAIRNTRKKPLAKSTTNMVNVLWAILVSVGYVVVLLIANDVKRWDPSLLGYLVGQIAGGTLIGIIIGRIVMLPFKRNDNSPKSVEVEPQSNGDATKATLKRDTIEIPEEELRALKRLRDAGILTEEEFTEKKKKLLGI